MSTELNESTTKKHIDETHERGPFMQLCSGTKWFPHAPRVDEVHIPDMRAIARICRFGGHSTRFYSVATHSTYVATMLAREGHDAETQYRGLIHDAHEAYFPGDVPAPMKRANPLNQTLSFWLREVDARALHVVRTRLQAPPRAASDSDRRWHVVREFDLRALATERHTLMAIGFDWELDVQPFSARPVPEEPDVSWFAWLHRLAELAEQTGRSEIARLAEASLVAP